MAKYNILDLFCGAGGFSNGFERNKSFQLKVAIDNNISAIETLKKNSKNVDCIIGDIQDSKIKEKIIELSKKNKVNMIIGGPPCQGFSNKGKKLGLNDPRNFLFIQFIDLVKSIKPKIFVIENVKNLITSSDGYFIKEILKEFQTLDYIVNYGILNSKDFGIPQKRERAIIIGTKKFSFDFAKLEKKQKKYTSVRDAISDLSFLGSNEGQFKSEYKFPANSEYQKTSRLNSKNLYNHVATNHSKIALKKLKLIPPESGKENLPIKLLGKQKFKTTWSRLVWDEPSPTIDTRFDTPSNGRNSHPFLNRAITPREAARIQGFSDDFVFYGNKTEICKQIGNAVPPPLSKALADSIIDQEYELCNSTIKDSVSSIYNDDSYNIVNIFKKEKLKVDHIITDPPYSISKNNNFRTMKFKRHGVDFGDWDRNFNFVNWIKPYIELLNKNGSIIIFCSYRYISFLIKELEENGMVVKDFIEWKKTNPMPRNINRRYVQDTEFAIWAVWKNSNWVFNKPKNLKYLKSCFTTSTVSGNERTIHPTQKSLFLLEQIIKIHTNKNQIILDPFMGSGTTGVAALKNHRKFIGIESNKKYFEIAKNRISDLK